MSAVERAVVDTNVWVSGLINPHGAPGTVLRAVAAGELIPVSSSSLIEEMKEVLERPRLRERFHVTAEDLAEALAIVEHVSETVSVTPVSLRDHDDEAVLSAAVQGRVDVIITGDHDLLDDETARLWLTERGVRLLTPAEWASGRER